MTAEEKTAMYNKLSKRDVIRLLIETQQLVDNLSKFPSVSPPRECYPSLNPLYAPRATSVTATNTALTGNLINLQNTTSMEFTSQFSLGQSVNLDFPGAGHLTGGIISSVTFGADGASFGVSVTLPDGRTIELKGIGADFIIPA